MNEWQRIPKARRDDECAKRLGRCIDLFDWLETIDAARPALLVAVLTEPGILREVALQRLALKTYETLHPSEKGASHETASSL